MNTQQLIPLFDPATLEKITQALQEAAPKDAKYQAIVIAEVMNKRAHSTLTTSLVRVLSTQETCGCGVYEEKEVISNGKSSIESKFLLTTNKEARGGKFRTKVGNLILQLVQNNFRDEDKLALYRACYKDTLRANTKTYSFELSKIPAFKRYVLNHSNWQDISLQNIEELITDLHNYSSISLQENPMFALGCGYALLYLSDLKKICTELQEPKYVGLRAAILKGEFYKRYDSPQGVHCELAAIERSSEAIGLENTLQKINKQIQDKTFTISKSCCYMCALIFMVFSNYLRKKFTIEAQNSGKEIPAIYFTLLGNSGAVFPNYKTLHLLKNTLSVEIAKALQEDLEKLLHIIKKGDYETETASLIENSDVIEMVYNMEKHTHQKMSTLRL